jgi:hypothetical protein
VAFPPAPHRGSSRSLHDELVGLAGTPDDDSRVGAHLTAIAQLAADRIGAVDYASITSRREDAYATVAASSDLAAAVDEAQYGDDAGPCLDALEAGYPTAVPKIAATMTWPGFRETAFKLGLRASLSIPLFAGSGSTVAALNLYGRVPATMTALTTAVWHAYDPDPSDGTPPDDMDPGGRQLVSGLVDALAVRAVIQQAIGVLIAATRGGADSAYRTLRIHAAETGRTLADTAAGLVGERRG